MNLELELTIEDPDYEINCEVDETIDMGTKVINPITITKNGVYRGGVSNGKQVGYSPVTVDVKPDLQPLEVTENGTYTPEEGTGYSTVNVDVPIPKVKPVTITENGVHDVADGEVIGANPITVDVKPNPVPITITENGVYENEQGFSPVTVNTPFQKTSGVFTRGSGYSEVTIAHGLPKPPKLVLCFVKDYATKKGTLGCGFMYTEKVATCYRNSSVTEPSVSAINVTIPNYITPSYAAISVDGENVYVSSPSTSWQSGDYEWEAYTW